MAYADWVTPPEMARVLTESPVVTAESEGGWLYLTLADGREVFIGCEYGQSLDLEVRPA